MPETTYPKKASSSAYWVTFYSYKGGGGRTLALINTAAYLAEKGNRVLLLDFDLEAPGLDEFEDFRYPSGKDGSGRIVRAWCFYLCFAIRFAKNL